MSKRVKFASVKVMFKEMPKTNKKCEGLQF